MVMPTTIKVNSKVNGSLLSAMDGVVNLIKYPSKVAVVTFGVVARLPDVTSTKVTCALAVNAVWRLVN